MQQKVLIIGKVWPESRSSAAGSRMMQLIDLFLRQGWKVSFASAANESEFSDDLPDRKIEKHLIELNNSSFDSFIKDQQPSIVVFDRFTTEEQFGWRVAENCPDALRILDTEDLHCLRAARQTALKEKRTFEVSDLMNTTAKRELASIYRCDLSLIISEYEMQILQDYFKVNSSLLLHLPFLLDQINARDQSGWPGFSAREHFLCVGNFLHEPNWDAVLFLKQEIWPLIRKKLPKSELHVYGAYPSQKVFELNNSKEGFVIKGRAEDISTVMRKARVCIAPLRFGAGLKGKLIDAMLNGTPSVTTDIGSESMNGSYDWCGKIANNAKDIADAATNLYVNEELWKQSQENGIKIINKVFNKKTLESDLLLKIKLLQNSLKEQRRNNFTGAMLMHHTALSSRYMALWIEEKNKKKDPDPSI